MQTSVTLMVLASGVVALHLVFYAFPRFEYEITEDALRIRRWVLGSVPLGRWEIRLAAIREARRSILCMPAWGSLLGGLYSLNGVIVVVDKRGLLAKRKVYVTPPDPDEFVRKMNALVGMAPGQAAARRPGPVAALGTFLPLWASDLVAAVSGIATFVAVSRGSYLGMVPTMLRLLGRWPAGRSLAVAAVALVVVVCFWMIADCFRRLRRSAQARFVLWLLAMFLFYPSAWFYYFLEWRPRHARAAASRRPA